MINKSTKNKIDGNNIFLKIEIFYLALFFSLSFIYIKQEKQDASVFYRASQLTTITTELGNQTITEYVNDKGEKQTAADLGYAIKVVTKENNNEFIQFYDENNIPAQNSIKCYAIFREYDTRHNIIRESCMDSDGNLMINLGGYSIQERIYDEEGKLIQEKYFGTDGMPICTLSNAYGRIYEYNSDNKIHKKTYVDDMEKPMKIGLGYATTVYTYYQENHTFKGKVNTEQYFDEKGNPVSLSLGQYGIQKEYDKNGQISKIVYLDKTMNPMMTNRGYGIVERTYFADNTIETEKYYDLSGNPVSLSEGQYGIRNTKDGTVYLDQNGNGQINIKNLLYNYSRIIIPLTMIGVILTTLIDKKKNTVFLVLYICIIAYLTIMYRNNVNIRNTGILWHYKKMFIDSNARADILKNIWLFIPLGAILYQLYPKKIIVFVAVALSMTIECIQYFCGIGYCELDDVISNTLGGIIGYVAGKLTDNVKQRINSWEHIHILQRR